MRKAKQAPHPHRYFIGASIGDIAYGPLFSDGYMMNTRRRKVIFWSRSNFTHKHAIDLLRLTAGQGVVSCTIGSLPAKPRTAS